MNKDFPLMKNHLDYCNKVATKCNAITTKLNKIENYFSWRHEEHILFLEYLTHFINCKKMVGCNTCPLVPLSFHNYNIFTHIYSVLFKFQQ